MFAISNTSDRIELAVGNPPAPSPSRYKFWSWSVTILIAFNASFAFARGLSNEISFGFVEL